MGIFDFFKSNKEKNSKRIKEKIQINKFEKRQYIWMDQVEEICSKEEANKIINYHAQFFTQLKVNVFTLLAPVNLKDERKLRIFYSHKFSIGYLFGFLVAVLQSEEFMKRKEKELLRILMIALMQDLFDFTKESAEKISNSINSKDPEFYDSENFKVGLVTGSRDWNQFAKDKFSGIIGNNFAEKIKEFEKDFL